MSKTPVSAAPHNSPRRPARLPTHPKCTRRGYVLLVTLVLLALVSLSLVGITRLSLARAAEARRAGRELQQRWGTLSLRHAVLPRAEAVLALEGARQRRPVVTARRGVTLGGITFGLVLSDEQAKANAGALLAAQNGPSSEDGARRTLRELLVGSPLATRLRLRPVALEDAGEGLGGIGSLSQIFENFDPSQFLPDGPEREGDLRRAPCDLVTCWGDGRLNVWRVPEPTLRALAVPALSLTQVQKLIGLRDQTLRAGGREPTVPPTLDSLLDRVDLTDEQRADADRLLRDGSACHGLWIVAESGPQIWYTLAVQEGVAEGAGRRRTHLFEW